MEMAVFSSANLGKEIFFSSLLQLTGSRVEVYEGKVVSSLEPHFKFRFVKFKFL